MIAIAGIVNADVLRDLCDAFRVTDRMWEGAMMIMNDASLPHSRSG